MKTKQVVGANGALETLVRLDREKKLILSSATRLKLAGGIRQTRPVTASYEEERVEMVKKLGVVLKDKPGVIQVLPENQAKFDADILEAGEVEADVVITPITTDDLFGSSDLPAKDQNQIDIDFILILQDFGIVSK